MQIRSLIFSCLLLIAADALTVPTRALGAAACSDCGCEAEHCNAGVPGHLRCFSATRDQKEAIELRKEALKDALRHVRFYEEVRGCNEAVGKLTKKLGYTSFAKPGGGYMKANEMHDYLNSGSGARDGWVRLRGNDITQHADVGQLVVGVIHSGNYPNGKPPFEFPLAPSDASQHGHVFVVLPGSKWDDSPYDWRDLKIWQSNLGFLGIIETTANDSSRGIKRDARSFVQFFFLRKP